MKNFRFLIMLFVALLFSCKKKELTQFEPIPLCYDTTYIDMDTIFPSNYSMFYPGSWWHYNDGSTDSCSGWEKIIHYQTTAIDPCEVVFVSSRIRGLHNYTLFNEGLFPFSFLEDPETPIVPMVNVQVGDTLYDETFYTGQGQMKKTIKKRAVFDAFFSTFQVQGTTYNNVVRIIVMDYWWYDHIGTGVTTNYILHLAENVGIIKWSHTSSVGNNVDKELVNYYIAPH